MKNNRGTPFVANLKSSIQTDEGRMEVSLVSYARFNEFKDESFKDSFFIDIVDANKTFQIVSGSGGTGGLYSATTGSMSDFNIYGSTVYTNLESAFNTKLRLPLKQKGVSFPICAKEDGSTKDSAFMIRRNSIDLDPSKLGINSGGYYEHDAISLTYMIKFRATPTTAKSLMMIADPSGQATLSVDFTSSAPSADLQIKFRSDGGPGAIQTHDLVAKSAKGKWITLFFQPLRDGSYGPSLGPSYIFDTATGKQLSFAGTTNDATSTTVFNLTEANLYLGYGEPSGGANPAFTLSDFLAGVDIAEFAVFNGGFTEEQITKIAKSHLAENYYRSGFNNRAPRKVQQMLDARTTYPRSSIPSVPASATDAFDDTRTRVFGQKQQLVFPEMIPALQWSGSNPSAGTAGPGGLNNSSRFYRDIHRTPFDKRLVTTGAIRQSLYHNETELFNESIRNSPITTALDSKVLGGTIKPFNDASPQSRLANERAVGKTINPDFDQKIGDHIAIVIDLDPVADTTIGVERLTSGHATGKVTSMAYYNFDTRKWETSGKNNDFIIPGAMRINSSSYSPHRSQNAAEILANTYELFESASVGFTGTSGFTVYENMGPSATADLGNRGLPTSNYGFPVHKKYEAKDGQLIDMSKHIDAPFILERVSFEFGAAIEESGPHSLGYKLPLADPNNSDALNEYVHCYFKTTTKCSLDNGFSEYGEGNDFSLIRRGAFLNGSPVVNLGDYWSSGILKEGAGDAFGPSGFTHHRADRVNQLLYGAETPVFGQLSENGFQTVSTTGTARNGIGEDVNAKSLQIDFYNPLKIKSLRSLDNNNDYGLTSLTASMFLKTSMGPRKESFAQDNRLLSCLNDRSDSASGDRKLPISVMPVLCGGHNGIVTASISTTTPLTFDMPVLGLFQNDADDQLTDDGSTKRSWFSSEGGTPFWRTDTFFLMKQSRKVSKTVGSKIRIKAASSNTFFPALPFHVEAQAPPSSKGMDFYQYGPSWGDLGSANGEVNRTGLGARSWNGWIRENWEDTDPVRKQKGSNPDGSVTIEVSSNADTTRELITFGQMAHYGYANAAIGVQDTIWDSDADHPYASSSWDNTSRGQLFNGGLPQTLDLYTQAIKIARGNDFGFSVIPLNLESHNNKRQRGEQQTSVFSDFPDTAQSQWTAPQESWARNGSDWTFNILPRSGVGTTQVAGSLTAAVEGRKVISGPPGRSRYAVSGVAGAAFNNESFYGLDTWATPLLRTGEVGSRDGYTISIPEYAIHVSTADTSSPKAPKSVLEQYSFVSFSPFGSGFSIISTPAYIASEARNTAYLTGSMTEDFARFGSFTKTPQEWLKESGATLRSSTMVDRPTKSWLDAGLSRDLNIYLSASQRHEGKNPGFGGDNFCGFTIMTASTVWRPFEPPGRESASLPLVSNVYKRQYLNYSKDFKIDVPIRAEVPRSAETPGTWAFQCTNFYRAPTWNAHTDDIDIPNSINDSTSRMGERLLGAGRYAYRGAITIVDGGFKPGVNVDGMGSNRRYQGSVGAQEAVEATSQAIFNPGGSALQFSAGKLNENTGQTFTIGPDDYDGIMSAGLVSGSFAKDPTIDSLYLLDPSDKLVLGVQPALPGWNPGSGLPNNRYANKWGIWNYSGSYQAGYALAHDVSLNGLPKVGNMINLEDPYEPSHGLTMLKTPSRVVLYGTFVSNQKPYTSNSTQVIGSDSIHEAIHYDNPVLDQFLLGNEDDYAGSRLAQHITGSTLLKSTDPRGIAGSVEGQNLFFSGSLQRFSRFSESSEVIFDTLMHDPMDIARYSDNGAVYLANTAKAQPYSIVNLHFSQQPKLMHSSSTSLKNWWVGTAYEKEYTHAFSHDWADSFPFEPKYAKVRRLLSLETKFGATSQPAVARLAPVKLQRDSSLSVGPSVVEYLTKDWSNSPYADEFVKWTTSPGNGPWHVSGSNSMVTDEWFDNVYQDVIYKTNGTANGLNDPDQYNTSGFEMVSISNMANVRKANFTEGQTGPTANFGNYPPSYLDRDNQRMFFATMVGYGRANRKQLDIVSFRGIDYETVKAGGTTKIASLRGAVIADHPAGFKFGYMNCDHLNPSAVFRSDRYGQFRDMLEQRIHTKVYSKTSEFSPQGELDSPVSCIFVDQSGQPVDDPTTTSCLNISTAMTASKPFIEDSPTRNIIFNTDYVTIDAFSLDLPKLTL